MKEPSAITEYPVSVGKIRRSTQILPLPKRRQLAESVVMQLQSGDVAQTEPIVYEMISVLGADPEWQVRLVIARNLYLCDTECFSDLAINLCKDSNSYVRAHAELSLSRQSHFKRKKQQESKRTRNYVSQVDALTEKYGCAVVSKIQQLAETRNALLASSVAHSIKSVLTTLKFNLHQLPHHPPIAEKMASLCEDIALVEQIVQNMELFVKDLPIEKHHESLSEMIYLAIEKAHRKLLALGYDLTPVQLDVQLPENISIQINRHLFVLAMVNLIKNAYEAFAGDLNQLEKETITISGVIQGYHIQIKIVDNGPGIEPENLLELKTFAPGNINKNKKESTGFGLPIAHRYILAMGGLLDIESQVDCGTTLIITLPLKEENNESACG